jgi:hypothetical protein
MSKRVFQAAEKQLEATRERLLITSMLLTDCAKDLPVGRRSNRTKRFLAVNLKIIVADYERIIQELTEQLEALRIVQAGVQQ